MTAVEIPKMSNPLEVAKAEMTLGEALLWAETSLSRNASRRSLPISILGWILLLLSLAWITKAAITSTALLFIGLPFIILGAGLASTPWWWPVMAKRTVYAISDQRLLIIRHLWNRKVTSYGPEDIDAVERRERRDGSGDVIFRREEIKKLNHHHDRHGKRRVGEREVGFFGVPEVRRVEEAIWALKQKRQEPDVLPPSEHGSGTSPAAPEKNASS